MYYSDWAKRVRYGKDSYGEECRAPAQGNSNGVRHGFLVSATLYGQKELRRVGSRRNSLTDLGCRCSYSQLEGDKVSN
jgi:hypothetical protein